MTNIWRGSSSASSRYYYDIAGNLITSIVRNATNCYYYTMQNKLAKIEGTNFIYRFLYNSRNERIAIGKAVNGSDMSWRYDACNGPVCIAEFDESAYVSTYFVRGSGIAQGIGDVIAEVNYDGTSEEIHYYLYNHRGDVVCVVNPGSTPNTTYRYDAYGRCYENYGSYTSRYTFSTKEYLPDANLYLYQYRVYDPQAGRWTQRDPIDYADSINLYQFCGNNPINTFDINGLRDRSPEDDTPPEAQKEYTVDDAWNDYQKDKKLPNCFSYVTGNDEYTSEEDLGTFLKGYDELNDSPSQEGDIAVWVEGGWLSDNYDYIHAGVVTQVDSDGYATEITSRMGIGGDIYKHHPRVTERPGTDDKGNYPGRRVYYRKGNGKRLNFFQKVFIQVKSIFR